MTDFFTSDLHLGHRYVAELRGFGTDVHAHDEAVIANWNKVVKSGDVTYVLGDVTLKSFRDVKGQIRRLNGTKHLISGNHDGCHPMHRRAYTAEREHLDSGCFSSVQPFRSRWMEGRQVLFSHFPYNGDGRGKQDRCVQWRLRDEGLVIVHGHTHEKTLVSYSDKGTLQIHVGMDARDMTPVPEPEIMATIRRSDAIIELGRLGQEIENDYPERAV